MTFLNRIMKRMNELDQEGKTEEELRTEFSVALDTANFCETEDQTIDISILEEVAALALSEIRRRERAVQEEKFGDSLEG